MKPNCMNCHNLLTTICPIFHAFRDIYLNDPMFWDSLSEMVKNSAVVCDLYIQKKTRKEAKNERKDL